MNEPKGEGQLDEILRVDIGEENLRRTTRRSDTDRRASTTYEALAPVIYGRDRVVNSVCLKLQGRSRVGVDKYGTTLAESKESRLAFLIHAQEEAMDLANYLEVLIQKENQ